MALLVHPEACAGPVGEKLIVETSVESFHISQALVADFNERNPGMEAVFTVDRDAIGLGERNLGVNRIHIGVDGADHLEKIMSKKIYLEIVAIVVNEKNPASDVTLAQIQSLLMKREDPQVITWSDLSAQHSGEIAMHGPLVVSEVARFMMTNIVNGVIGGYHEHERFSHVAQAVSKDQFAMGFLPLGYARQGNLKTLSVSGASPHDIRPGHREDPTQDYPLMRAVSLYADKSIHADDANSKTVARRFVDYVFSRDGSVVINQSGMLPWKPSFIPEAK